eukprot:1575083-Prymnesium_polylepis.2
MLATALTHSLPSTGQRPTQSCPKRRSENRHLLGGSTLLDIMVPTHGPQNLATVATLAARVSAGGAKGAEGSF